ncbi:dipeptide epimerase [Sphingopyxis sp.]|uniref:dipeptide epimerase n=1 Tax=Sphingopyxis sp. TaxID=1908224 RepID=UPI002D779069|nr:dipeptide epimerase [Sphingopyxis sp.]HET6523553.1 dipeptide epimerase [Sphingopyxis sp.]
MTAGFTAATLDSLGIDDALARLAPCSPNVEVELARLALAEPFCIAGHIFEEVETAVLRLEADGHVGHAEAAGVFYRGDMPSDIVAALREAKETIARGIGHADSARLFPAGGARNAFDCALWDLQAKRMGLPVWQLLGIAPPAPLLTTYTIGSDTPDGMAAKAVLYSEARAIKIKLVGDAADASRVAAVRAARPDVWLAVDANRSLAPESVCRLLPALEAADVRLIEQPFAVGRDAELAGLNLPIPVAADESIQTMSDLERLAGLYQAVNVKLDKCGGLTDGLRLAQRARQLGLDVMVGNMLGSSLAMAPAFLLGQFCSIVDLDGPIFLAADCVPGVSYRGGRIDCMPHPWGSGR